MQNVGEGDKSPISEKCNSTIQIRTPVLLFPNIDDSLSSPEKLKLLYQYKCKELDDMQDYKYAEVRICEEERMLMESVTEENEKLKSQLAEIPAMRSEVERLKKEVSEKEIQAVRAMRDKSDKESFAAGVEMQFEAFKAKMSIREKELLSIIESGDVVSKMKVENNQLRMEIQSEKLAREEEITKSEKIIADLTEKMNQSEMARQESEKKVDYLSEENNYEKISEMQIEVDNLRKAISLLQDTISTLELENKELSIRIMESTSVCDESDVTLKEDNASLDMDSTQCAEDISLLEMDQTLLCKLVSKSDSYTMQKSSLESLQSDNKRLTEENEKLSSQLFESAQETDDLQTKLQKMQKCLDDVKVAQRNTSDELKETEASVKILQGEKDALVEEIMAFREQRSREKKELELQINFYSDKATRCEGKIMELNTMISDLVLENEAMKEKANRSQLELNNKIEENLEYQDLSEKYLIASKLNAENKAKMIDLQEENKILDHKFYALMDEVESLREKISSDADVLQEKESKIRELLQCMEIKNNLVEELERKVCDIKPKLIVDRGAIEEVKKCCEEKVSKMIKEHEEIVKRMTEEKRLAEDEKVKVFSKIELLRKDNEDKMHFYKSELSQHEDTIVRNNKRIDELILENARLKENIDEHRETAKTLWELREQIADYRNKETESGYAHNHLKNTLQEVAKECVEQRTAKELLQKEIDNLRSSQAIFSNAEIVQLQKKLHESETAVEQMTNRVVQLQSEVEKVEGTRMKTIEEMRNTHESQVKELRGIISDEEVKQQQLQVEKDKLDSVNQELRRIVERLKTVLDEESTRSEKELQIARQSNEQFQKTIDEIHEKHREEIKSLKTERINIEESTKAQMDQLKEILATKNGAYEQLSSNYRSQQQKFNEVERENEANRAELESLRERITHITELSFECEQEKAQLQLELQQKASLIHKLSEKLNRMTLINPDGLKEELQRIKSHNDSLKVEIGSMKKLTEEKTSENVTLKKQLHDKCTIIETMEKDKRQSSDTVALQKEIDQMVKDWKSMKLGNEKEIKSLKDANKFIGTERDHLKKKLSVIGEKDKDIDLLKDRIRKKDKTIDKINALLKEKMIEINDLRIKKSDRGRDSSPSNKAISQKERRKSDRQSLYDVNRSIVFDLERDASTMTDPTSELCQCKALSDKISHLQSEIGVLKYKLSGSALSLETNSLKNDVQVLQLDLKKKDLTISILNEDAKKLQQLLKRAEGEKRLLREQRLPSGAHAASQTESPHSELIAQAALEKALDELKSLQEQFVMIQSEVMRKSERIRQLEEPMHQKENDSANCNINIELDVLKEKYNNLKRAYFAMRVKYEGP